MVWLAIMSFGYLLNFPTGIVTARDKIVAREIFLFQFVWAFDF